MESYKNTHALAARTTKKDSDYLRFRPYHAFTAPEAKAVLGRVALIIGFVALLIYSGRLLLLAIT